MIKIILFLILFINSAFAQTIESSGSITINAPINGICMSGYNIYNNNGVIGCQADAGTGTVTNVSVVTANGISASVANPTTTPALTFTLGAITPTTVNGVTIPTTSDTVALLGTAQTFTAANNFSAAGSLSVPTLAFGNCGTNCGILAPATGQLQFTVAGAAALDYGITNAGSWSFAGVIQTASSSHFAIRLTNNAGSIAFRGGNTFLGSPANASLQLGDADSATPVAQTLRFQSGATLNTPGVNDTLIASLSAGSGNSGDFVIQTGVKSGVSGTLATPTTAIAVKGETQQVNFAGQINVASMTQTAAAQTGSVCYNSGTGAITYDASTTCLLSSKSLKHDWRPLQGALAEVLALNPVDFLYDDQATSPGRQIGFLAEEVAVIDHRLAVETPGRPPGVRYINMVPLLAKAIQEMKGEIDMLRVKRNRVNKHLRS